MSEFRSWPEEGFSEEFVPDFGGMNFDKILNEDAYDDGTSYELADYYEFDDPAGEIVIERNEDPFRRFERAYRQQGVKLNPTFLDGITDIAPVGHCFNNEEELKINRAVAFGGRMLRKNPNEKLADRSIELPSEHDIPQCETSMKTLETIINSSIERPLAEELPKHQFKSDGIEAISMCPKAEKLFDKAVPRTSKFKAPGLFDKLKYQVIADEGDNGWDILGVRKWEGVPSVLTFKDVAVDGIQYPSGSIMRFELETDGPPERGKYTEYINQDPPRIVSSNEVVRVGFLRLANGFAGEPGNIDKLIKRVKNDLRLEVN
jgi:hypothetical protein